MGVNISGVGATFLLDIKFTVGISTASDPGVQKKHKQSKIFTVCFLILAMTLQCFFPVSTAVAADVFPIPEIDSRSPELFVLDSVAKLDDFIESVDQHIFNRRNKGWSFVGSATIQVVAIAGVVVEIFFFKSRILAPISDGIKDAGTVGKVGAFSMDSLKVIRRWFIAGGVAQNVTEHEKEKVFKVHPEDLPEFRKSLVALRSKQYGLLYQLLKQKSKLDVAALTQFHSIDTIIRENRPSFRKEFDECIKNSETYKDERYFRAFKKGAYDYLKLLFVGPVMINHFVDSRGISPSLHSYLNQETLGFALDKCLNPGETMGSQHSSFVMKLYAADAAARISVAAIIYLLIRSKAGKKANPGTSLQMPAFIQKLMSTWVGNVYTYVQTIFSKISPKLIARVLGVMQIISSSVALYDIKNEWDEVRDKKAERHSAEEFLRLGKAYFTDRANAQVYELKKALQDRTLDTDSREEIEDELVKWSVLIDEINQTEIKPKS